MGSLAVNSSLYERDPGIRPRWEFGARGGQVLGLSFLKEAPQAIHSLEFLFKEKTSSC